MLRDRQPSSSNTSSSFTSMNHTLIVRQGVCDDAAGAAQHARSRHVQRDSALKPGSTTRKSCGVYRARRLSCTVMWCCAWSWWFFPCRTVCHPHFQGFLKFIKFGSTLNCNYVHNLKFSIVITMITFCFNLFLDFLF